MCPVRPWAALLLAVVAVLVGAPSSCAELEPLAEGSGGGPGVPPSGSLSVSFIDVGQGDGVLVQAGGESYLIDAGRPEEGRAEVAARQPGMFTRRSLCQGRG